MLTKTRIFAALLVGSAAAVPASAEGMKFANFMASTHPYVAGCFQRFADEVGEATDGALTIEVYNGGELGTGPSDQYSRVIDGVTEFAISLPGYTASSFPLTLINELPGVIEAETGTKEIWDHIDLFKDEYERAHLISLWSSAPNLLFTSGTPVDSPDDMKGLKIRVPSRNTGLLVEAWGGSPVSMPVSDIYNAMQTGVINGAMIDATAVNAFKLSEVADYITMGMHTTNSPFFILMNPYAYDELDDATKARVHEVGRKASMFCNQVQLDLAVGGLKQFASTPGKKIIELSPEEAAVFDELSTKVTEEVVSSIGGNAPSILDAMEAQ